MRQECEMAVSVASIAIQHEEYIFDRSVVSVSTNCRTYVEQQNTVRLTPTFSLREERKIRDPLSCYTLSSPGPIPFGIFGVYVGGRTFCVKNFTTIFRSPFHSPGLEARLHFTVKPSTQCFRIVPNIVSQSTNKIHC